MIGFQEEIDEMFKKISVKEFNMTEEKGISDSLIIGFDYAPKENPCLVVARRETGQLGYTIINCFYNDEALELYNKLVGNDKLYI